jgi:drug/metabolite transporter (DMT)-like permease
MQDVRKAYLELHIAVILFGFTAILGDLIKLSALQIVWWRVLLTSVSLLFFIRFGTRLKLIPRKRAWQYMGIGCLVALHWLCFYGAIKYANASIAVVTLATTSVFTSLLEPLLLRQRFKWYELGIGLLVIPGMILIVNATDFSMRLGVWVGLASALLASLFSTLNKKLITHSDPMHITFLEISSAWLFLSIVFPFYLGSQNWQWNWPTTMDWIYLIILALLCTTLAYFLALKALHHISAFASNLVINLEPVYGIILAWLLLRENEELQEGFYFGVAMILLVVFSYPLIRRKFEKQPI